jgi:hypothetical protein
MGRFLRNEEDWQYNCWTVEYPTEEFSPFWKPNCLGMRLTTLDPHTISRQLYICGGLCNGHFKGVTTAKYTIFFAWGGHGTLAFWCVELLLMLSFWIFFRFFQLFTLFVCFSLVTTTSFCKYQKLEARFGVCKRRCRLFYTFSPVRFCQIWGNFLVMKQSSSTTYALW